MIHERKQTTDAPLPDIADLTKQYKVTVLDKFELLVKRISFVVLEAAFMTPKKNNVIDIGFSQNLKFYIICREPRADELSLNPHWKQYEVNGEWVGNIHGMERYVADLCWKEIESQFEEVLNV
jgi:hypothetical protein